MVFLGILFNTSEMTLSVTTERLKEIDAELKSWLNCTSATKRKLQSLLGKLQFVAKCVHPARVFVARLLEKLRMVEKKSDIIFIDHDMSKDLLWWHLYLPNFNGVTMLPFIQWSMADSVMATDSCLTGCGGYGFGQFFHAKFKQLCSSRVYKQNL